LSVCGVHHSYDTYMEELQQRAGSIDLQCKTKVAQHDQNKAGKPTATKSPTSTHHRHVPKLSNVSTALETSSSASRYEMDFVEPCFDHDGGSSAGQYQSTCTDGHDTLHQEWTQQTHMMTQTLADCGEIADAFSRPCPALVELEPQVPGDWGHPELCSRPCIFAAKGMCTSGSSCVFCHLPHSRPQLLDKRGRTLLKAMLHAERASLILSIVESKAASIGLGKEASQLLDELVSTCPNAFTGVRKAKFSRVAPAMENMMLRQLLLMASACEIEGHSVFSEIIKKHMDQMRLSITHSLMRH